MHVTVDADALPELRETYGLEKGLARAAFYGMGANQKFFTYAELAKRYEDTLDLPQPEVTEEEEEESQEA
jgi:hypothetical protein